MTEPACEVRAKKNAGTPPGFLRLLWSAGHCLADPVIPPWWSAARPWWFSQVSACRPWNSPGPWSHPHWPAVLRHCWRDRTGFRST